MKSRLLFAMLAILAGAAHIADATTWYVRKTGNDQADGKAKATAFKSVLRAVQAVDHGDSIVIGPGTYRDSALLAERFSADGALMTIEGDESGRLTGDPAGPVVLVPVDVNRPALHLYRVRNVAVSGLTFAGPGQGLRVEKSLSVTATRCTFRDLTQALTVAGTVGFQVESSVFSRCTLGVSLAGTVNARVAHVTITGSTSAGLMALGCGAGTVANSILAGNGSNLIADEVSAPAWTSDHNVIHGTCGVWGPVPVIAKVYEWFAASGQDRHSVHVVPAFADPAKDDFHVAPAVTWAGGLPGLNVGTVLEPKVEVDRDGRPFRVRAGAVCAGAYDYPDPQPAPGWTKLAVKLDGPGPRQSAAVYLEDGTLVRNLVADASGLRELWWDGLDDNGQASPAGKYVVKTASHDVRIVDDGAMGDNGTALGAYNCDNPHRVVALPDGGWVISTIYDEAGFALRRYSSSGQPIAAVNLADKDINALALSGSDLYGAVGPAPKWRLQRFTLDGGRLPMANRAESYAICQPAETNAVVEGLAVSAQEAYVALGGLNVVRVFDLATGAKKAEWPVAAVGDIAADSQGRLLVVSGKEVLVLTSAGQVERRFATGLETPRTLAVSPTRIAVVDRAAARLVLLDAGSGQVLKAIGKPRVPGTWTPVGIDNLVDPRGCAFLPDGKLVLCEHTLLRVTWPETGKVCQELLSNFMDSAVVHPTKPEIVYCFPGAFRVDPKTGAWQWLVESPGGLGPPDDKGKPVSLSWGSPHGAVVLGGKPFIFYFNLGGNGSLRLVDVSNPLEPRQALLFANSPAVFSSWAYATVAFTKDGDIVSGGHYNTQFTRVKFKGLDGQGNPQFDFANPEKVGPVDDPVATRGMRAVATMSADRLRGDLYYMAVTTNNNKMVPAWGADGTGLGKSTPEGKPLWFVPSSGGNYQSLAAINDGQNAWIMVGKSFGGQIDLFDGDGLRLTTGNWNWPSHYQIGFIDLRYGLHGYLRPDGKVGAYVEDDAIGRFARCRVDGAATLQKAATPITWQPAGAAAGSLPELHAVRGKPLASPLVVPKVAALPVDGDWAAWEKAGVVPQIISLPAVTWGRSWPSDLWQTFRAGTSIGAIAHDGANFYVYFLCADDTPHFDAEGGNLMWEFDSVELWMEEEQFGLGLLKNGDPALFKYRYHNKEGREWAANYPLPRENVWGAKLDDLGAHPLGRLLGAATGVSFTGKPGYAVMGKIPFIEVKLVGGIAGRGGKDILNLTGQGGEVLRVGIAFDGINQWGREQDFKVYWPSGLIFSDPTTLTPFVLGQ